MNIVNIYKEFQDSIPWTFEPTKREITYKGFTCVILKNQYTLTLCGYLSFPFISSLSHHNLEDMNREFPVHNGWTNLNSGRGGHLPHKIRGGVTVNWVGFDCASSNDYVPYEENMRRMRLGNEIYKDSKFVTKELQRVIDMIISKYGEVFI